MTSVEKWLLDLDSDAEWKVWYQDTFDRECPRQVKVVGQGLAAGLTELWARHLFETVRADGRKGFFRFNLWWEQERKSIKIVGEWEGMIRLRKWIFGDQQQKAHKGYVGEGNQELLMRVAATHSFLILAGQTSEEILAAAKDCVSREDFEKQLLTLLKKGFLTAKNAKGAKFTFKLFMFWMRFRKILNLSLNFSLRSLRPWRFN